MFYNTHAKTMLLLIRVGKVGLKHFNDVKISQIVND